MSISLKYIKSTLPYTISIPSFKFKSMVYLPFKSTAKSIPSNFLLLNKRIYFLSLPKNINYMFSESNFLLWIIGMSFGFKQKLFLNGMGYTFYLWKHNLVVSLGLSHTYYIRIPDSLKVWKLSNSRLEVFSNQRFPLSFFLSHILSLRILNVFTLRGVYLQGTPLVKKLSTKLAL